MTTNEALVVSDKNENPDTLRARFQHYGYLHFKHFVDGPECEALLDDILGHCAPYIQRDEEGQRPTLQGDPFFESDATLNEIYPRIQSLENFHQFFHQPDILQLMETLSGAKPFVYPMKMARISTPKKIGYETPPHQDAHSHQAGDTMAGMWIALQDINENLGRLKLLPYSHKRGVRKVFTADGVGGVQCEIFSDEQTWHVSDVEQGDVIIFHSCCVHKAEPNRSEDTVRFSVDTRFCDYGAPTFISNFEPHYGSHIEGHNWESIYKDWKSDTQKYYWRDYPAVFSTLLER